MNRREFMKMTGITAVSLSLCKEVVSAAPSPTQGLTVAKLLTCKKLLENAENVARVGFGR